MNFSIFILALMFFSASVDGKAFFRSDYVYHKSAQGWLKVHGPQSWRNARLTCHNEGAILASPENEELLGAMSIAYLTNSRTPETFMFTGIHDTFSKGLLASLEGTHLDDMPVPWAPGKPDSNNDESCLSMHHNGMVTDSKCTDVLPFICFKKDPPTPPAPTCGPAENGYKLDTSNGSCYKFHTNEKYWRDAYAACYHEGAHLAIVNSHHEADVLKTLFQENEAAIQAKPNTVVKDVVHIGMVDWIKGDSSLWMSIDGQKQEDLYLTWHSGEPNNPKKQFCGGLFNTGDFDNVGCYDEDDGKVKRAFICEKKPKVVEDTASVNENLVQGS